MRFTEQNCFWGGSEDHFILLQLLIMSLVMLLVTKYFPLQASNFHLLEIYFLVMTSKVCPGLILGRIWQTQRLWCWVLSQCFAIWSCMIKPIGSRMLSLIQSLKGSIELPTLEALHQLLILLRQLSTISEHLRSCLTTNFWLWYSFWRYVQNIFHFWIRLLHLE